MTSQSRLMPYLYIAPLVLLLAFVFGYPLVRIFEFSFKMVRGIDGPWIGLRNYQLVLGQDLFWESVLHNLQLLLAIPAMVVISLIVSVLLYERIAGWQLYRIIVFVPFVLAIPIIAVVMKRMFQFSGPVNEVLRWLSLDFLALDWIGSSDVALWTVMILIVWRESALGIILFLARLLSLDESHDRGREDRRRELVAAPLVHHPAADARRHRVLRGGERHHHAGRRLRLCLRDGRRPRRTWHLHHGGRALHLQCADPHEPAWHRLGRLGPALLGLRPADLPAFPRPPPGPGTGGLMRKQPLSGLAGTALKQGVLLLAAFLALVPTLFMILTALKSDEEYAVDKLGFPDSPVIENFRAVLVDSPFLAWMANSVLLVIGAVLLSTIVSGLAAYAIACMEFKGRETLLALSTSLMAVPPVVMIVPLFVLYTQLGLISTYQGTILIYAGLITPFSVYLLTTFFRTVPKELFESARIDGAGPFLILIKIVLPLSLPAIVTLVVVNSLYVWNDLLIAIIFLQDDAKRTLMAGISVFQGRYNNQVPLTMAGMVIASAPMLILYIVFQKHFIRGLMAGAIK